MSTNISGEITNPTQSITFWGIMIIIIGFLIWAPFQRGLFNGYAAQWDRPIYSAFVWGAILLFVLALFLFHQWQYRNQRDFLTLFVWTLPLCYGLALIQAASHYFAWVIVYFICSLV